MVEIEVEIEEETIDPYENNPRARAYAYRVKKANEAKASDGEINY